MAPRVVIGASRAAEGQPEGRGNPLRTEPSAGDLLQHRKTEAALPVLAEHSERLLQRLPVGGHRFHELAPVQGSVPRRERVASGVDALLLGRGRYQCGLLHGLDRCSKW